MLRRAVNRRNATYAVSVAVVAAVLAGCGSSSPSSGGGGGGSKPSYTIAYEGPLSGGNQQLGLNMKFAVELAINQANAGTTFGSLPFTLKFTSADDQGSATVSPSVATSLSTNSNVIAVVGPAFSGATKAAEPTFAGANLATVSPSATDPALSQQGWHNFFRVVANDNAQGPADAQYMSNTLHIKSVYVVDDASAYAVGLTQAFSNEAKSLGMTVTSEEVPGTTQCSAGTGSVSQYPAAASKIKTNGAAAVFYGGYYCDFALFAKALRAAGYSGTLFSDDGSLDPHYVSGAGVSVAQGTFISCPCQDLTTSPGAASFTSQFKSLAGFPIGTYSGESYDATNVIIDAMKTLAGMHGAGSITRAEVVDELHAISWQGLTKTVKFQSNGEISGTAVFVYKVQTDGTIKELGPA